MATKEEVESFLSTFLAKSKLFGMVFLGERKKNIDTLAKLEISAMQMQKEILSLRVDNYKSGPIADRAFYHNSDMWEFGKMIKGEEIYIKITLGGFSNSTLCISFHIAEHKIKYPFSDIK